MTKPTKKLVDKPVRSGTPDRKVFDVDQAEPGLSSVPVAGGAQVCCAICLNQTSKRVPMATIVQGYAVCEAHVDLASQPGFNIFKLRSTGKSV